MGTRWELVPTPKSRLKAGLLGLACLAAGSARGVTILDKVTSDTTGIGNGVLHHSSLCHQLPDSSTDVWGAFDVSGAAIGDVAMVNFFEPNGKVYSSFRYNPLSSLGPNGYQCFSDPLAIAGSAPASIPGTWTVQVLWNNTPLFALSFAVSQAQTLIIPQVADGAGWQTTLVLTNTTTSATTASFRFFQDVGSGATQSWNVPFPEVTHSGNVADNVRYQGLSGVFCVAKRGQIGLYMPPSHIERID